MNFKTYQTQSKKTAMYHKLNVDNLLYLMNGLMGETGEVAENNIKKNLSRKVRNAVGGSGDTR